MPFKRHPIFVPAPSEEAKLWRYMNLPKFLSLLQTRSLFLCNLELMARSDPFEGTLPSSRFKHRSWQTIADLPESLKERPSGFLRRGEIDLEIGFKRLKELAELRIRQAYAHRRSYFINCWHLNEHESSAMWDVYSRRNEGIAIVSSESKLIASLEMVPQDVMGGVVSYGNYEDEEFVIDESNVFAPIVHKRNSFSYEREYRLAYRDTSVTHKQLHAQNGVFIWDDKILPDISGSGITTVGRSKDEIEKIEPTPGFLLTCDLDKLIGEIYVSPLAEDWFYSIIKDVAMKYGIEVPITRSSIAAEPLR